MLIYPLSLPLSLRCLSLFLDCSLLKCCQGQQNVASLNTQRIAQTSDSHMHSKNEEFFLVTPEVHLVHSCQSVCFFLLVILLAY